MRRRAFESAFSFLGASCDDVKADQEREENRVVDHEIRDPFAARDAALLFLGFEVNPIEMGHNALMRGKYFLRV